MKKSLTLALALIALAVLSGLGLAHPQRGTTVPPLPCCKCLGESPTIDISTGHVPWNVTLPSGSTISAPNVTPLASPSWCSTFPSPAVWIGPVAAPKDVPQGLYKYFVSFNVVQKCSIPSNVQLDVKFAADNGIFQVKLDGHAIAGNWCPTANCFLCGNAKTFSVPIPPATPLHTLEIHVMNNESYSGLIVSAKVTRQCANE